MPQPKESFSVTLRLPRAVCEALDVFGATTYPGLTRASVIRLLIEEHLAQRADDPAGTAQRQVAWGQALKTAFNTVAGALREASRQYDAKAAAVSGQPSSGIIFEDRK